MVEFPLDARNMEAKVRSVEKFKRLDMLVAQSISVVVNHSAHQFVFLGLQIH